MPRHFSIFLLAIALIAGCTKPKASTNGKLVGFPSPAAAENAVALATVNFEQAMPGDFRTSRVDGAWTVHFTTDEHDALLQTKTSKSANSTFEISWTFTVSGSDQKHNADVANLLAKYIAEEDANRSPSGSVSSP